MIHLSLDFMLALSHRKSSQGSLAAAAGWIWWWLRIFSHFFHQGWGTRRWRKARCSEDSELRLGDGNAGEKDALMLRRNWVIGCIGSGIFGPPFQDLQLTHAIFSKMAGWRLGSVEHFTERIGHWGYKNIAKAILEAWGFPICHRVLGFLHPSPTTDLIELGGSGLELGVAIFPTQNGKLEELLRQFSTTWQLKKNLKNQL